MAEIYNDRAQVPLSIQLLKEMKLLGVVSL